MSTATNKALVRRWLDAWASLDFATMDELFDAAYTVNGAPVGAEGVKQAVLALHAALAPVTVTLDDLIAEGDRVVVRWTLRGQHNGLFLGLAPTGKRVHLAGINIYRIAQGRIVSNYEQVNIQNVLHKLDVVPLLGQEGRTT